jgi:alkylhydroperoxidase family enzyme
MRAHFSDEAIVEITAALGLFLGFSKIAIALGHQPETLAAFQRIYGLLWRRGIVSAEIKETVRLRNALITDCGF